MNREQWARLAAATPLTLEESDLEQLQGISEELSMDEVVEVYLPLSRLINLRFLAADGLRAVTSGFLGRPVPRVPFVIGVAGSVAVGKSTLARLLQRHYWIGYVGLALIFYVALKMIFDGAVEIYEAANGAV